MAGDWDALKQRVREANDIVDVVGGYLALTPAGSGTFKALCPFHDDHNPSMTVDPRRQRFKCWACGKGGDVFTFVQEHDRVDFREALELLARRAGISLEKNTRKTPGPGRAGMLEAVAWAAAEFHRCLLDSPLAADAREYVRERRLADDTVRRFGLGFAPAGGDWLLKRAAAAGVPVPILEQVRLANRRDSGGHYDCFRDRVMFTVRDASGRAVGFGGRILPSSPLNARDPKPAKYYNSADSPVFTKSDQLYGIDQARRAAAAEGFLAVVEGYTDVLMAHQAGVCNVVATMGTALNARHVRVLRRFAPRVVLVFDADAGGSTGVDRALEIFVSQEVDLAVATLPAGMDPCDLLAERGADAFRAVLAGAVDALEFKMARALADESAGGVEGRRRAVDAVLGVIALAPELAGHAGAVKRELAVTRIAQRTGLREETVWGRLHELRAQRRPSRPNPTSEPPRRTAPAPAREKQLLQMLLADPTLVPLALGEIAPGEVEHPGVRLLLEGLYERQAHGQVPDLDGLRGRLDNPALLAVAEEWCEIGDRIPDRPARLRELFDEFRKVRARAHKQQLHAKLKQAAGDDTEGVELLRQIQERP